MDPGHSLFAVKLQLLLYVGVEGERLTPLGPMI